MHSDLKKILLLLCFVLLLSDVELIRAQGIIKGRVSDENGTAIELTNVAVFGVGNPIGTTTDTKGNYTLRIPSDTTLTLRISHVGYQEKEVPVRLAKGETRQMDFRLKTTSNIKNEVTISSEKTRTTSFTQIETERMEDLAGPNQGVEGLIKTLPDVNSNNEMSSQYSVRGGSYDENLVYVNGVEIFRPMLIRSGQQEGMSIINPDLIDYIQFSPGGFDATYGDKMSSVLDLTYARPREFKAKVSASFLGATASLRGGFGKDNRFAYAIGFRQHSNSYLFRSLETKGNYTTNYTDVQTVLGYRVNDNLDFSLLGIFSRNVYNFIPESATTMFGGFQQQMQLSSYFDGQERDRYRTGLGALTMDYHPSEDFQLKWISSVQRNYEREIYDIQCQYWLYQVEIGSAMSEDSGLVNRGVGTYLEHARNYLQTDIYSTELKATHYAPLGQWNWGVRIQHEQIDDRVREWKWVDSAGYAIPYQGVPIGNPLNSPQNPLLQLFCKANNQLVSNRAMAYLQRGVNLTTKRDSEIKLLMGLRGQLYGVDRVSNFQPEHHYFLVSPRASFSYKPHSKLDIVYRLATGIYHQPPLYREYRYDDGSLNLGVEPQHSYQVMGTADWNLKIAQQPFRLTADIYYKYITDLVAYRIDNLRIRYDADNDAVAYATGVSLRLAGEFVEGLESWASISVMKTQEDILGDTIGWIARPTDQRVSFKLFFQDYIPSIPYWRMSLNLVAASGLPYGISGNRITPESDRMRPYYRVDWGNTIELSRIPQLKEKRFFRHVGDVMISAEVFNLLDFRNVISYTWVSDYQNQYYHVPNYLTRRQLNLKLTVTF